MAFDAQALWDLSGPITMPAMSDNDFLMLLEKQMQAAHPTSGTASTADMQQNYGAGSANPMVSPSVLMAPPPQPVPADTLTPPLTDESSPSPPASGDNGVTVGDGSKRKATRDNNDDDGQPRSKVQHKANDDGVNSQPTDESAKKAPARRKSGGGTGLSEEGRLAKRKEQNRAAQRAFRDRKEKHVRDLEDKIQELEQKYATSESENTNLKDLLRRLQNENMILKQSAFTFEFSPDNKPNQATSPTANTASSLSSAGTNPFTSPSHSGSSASPESTTSNYVAKSPNNSLFNNTPSPNINARSESRDSVTVNSAGFMSFANPPSVQPTPATPALATPTLAISSPGAGPSTISQPAFNQNSLFTSYRDPTSAYTLGLPFGDFNTLATPAIGSEFMDLGMDLSMGADMGAFGLGSDFDDLFGGQLGALDGTSSYGGVGSVASPTTTSLMTPQTVSVSTPSTSVPQTAASTPAPQPVIIDGLPSVGESARVECTIKAPEPGDWRRCPKTRQEYIDLIRNDSTQPSTFGPSLTTEDKAKIEHEWQQFKQSPQFQEPDVDNLCSELFDKAQCSELKTRMKQSMMRIAKDLANGPPPA